MRVRSLKPISALYTDTFFTCTFLLTLTCALVSLLLSFEAAGAAAAVGSHHHHHHQQQQQQQHHKHNQHNNEIITHSVHHRLSQLQRQHGLGSQSHGHDFQRHSVGGHASDVLPPAAERDEERPPQRDPHLHKPHPDHPNRLEHMHATNIRVGSNRQHPMRFRGFATPARRAPTSVNISEHQSRLDAESDNEFDSYSVDDVFTGDDSQPGDADDDNEFELESEPDDSDEQLEDEEEDEDDEEDEGEQNEADNEIDLEAHFQGPARAHQRPAAWNHMLNQASLRHKYSHQASRNSQRYPNGLDQLQSVPPSGGGTSRKPVRANRRHHELPKPRVPYQTPIVVSISDNSFVSASPMVLTTSRSSSSSGSDDLRASSSAYEDSGDEPATSDKRQFTTSTTATTTREAFTEPLQRSRPGLELDLEEDRVGGRAQGKRATSRAPIVLGNMKRYNYNIVSDLERQPRRLASGEQQEERLESSVSLEVQLPRTRSGTMQTSEPNVDLAPTVGTLSVLVDDLEPDDKNLDLEDDSANEIDSLDDKDDHEDDGDGDDDDPNDDRDDEQAQAGQEVEMDARFARASQQLDELVRQSAVDQSSASGKYAHLAVNPRNELPSYGRRHLASIRMIQGNPNEYQQTGALNGAIIAILFGIGVTGVLVLIVGVKMRSIRERIAHKGRRRSLVPDTDFLINTIPI